MLYVHNNSLPHRYNSFELTGVLQYGLEAFKVLEVEHDVPHPAENGLELEGHVDTYGHSVAVQGTGKA